jgi:hypothetical protein
MKEYIIRVNEEQAKVISDGLRFYARIMTGQFDEIIRMTSWRKAFNLDSWAVKYREARSKLNEAKALLTNLVPFQFRAIVDPNTPEESKIAWDVSYVISHRLAWDNNPKGGVYVQFDKPVKTASTDLPTIEEKE